MSSGGYQSAGLKRRQFAHKVKWYMIISFGAIFGIGIVYILGFSSLFQVKKFEVIGAFEGQEDRILAVLRPQIVARFPGSLVGVGNYFAWNNSLLYEDIRSNRVSVEKSFWSREVRVIVHPRERYGVWCILASDESSDCYWIDGTGIVFESAPIPAGQIVIAIFESASATRATLGTHIIKPEYFDVIKRVAESLEKLVLPVTAIVVDRDLEEVQLLTTFGTKIMFSLRFDPAISALPALAKLMESPGIAGMRTIDFTVENRVFYTAK